jgi:hypothetical protein
MYAKYTSCQHDHHAYILEHKLENCLCEANNKNCNLETRRTLRAS